MSGIYNATYFANHPEIAQAPGILYCVILVNKKTFEREVLKIGIAGGRSFKDAIRRSSGFKGYDIKIQKIYSSTLEDCWRREQALHEQFKHFSKLPSKTFGGYTECFEIKAEIIEAFPKNKS